MIIVEARDKIARIHYAALELINRHTGRVNIPGLILEGLTESKRVPTNKENVKRISELRKRLIKHLGLRSNPFNLRRGVGWEPLFRISDNRNAQDERAKHAAKHVEFNDDLKEHTQQNCRNYSEDDYGDLGAFWRRGLKSSQYIDENNSISLK